MTHEDGELPVKRRDFLRATAGTAVVAGATGAATAQEGGTVTVEAVDFAFNPGTDEPLVVPPGTTVQWVWKSDSHNIKVDSQPSGANWEGHETIENTGFEYEHTFETVGEYHYWCVPHKGLGMVADIVVEEGAPLPGEGGGEGGGHQSILPDAAKTIGVASVGGMASVLGLSYFFLKYGGDYGDE